MTTPTQTDPRSITEEHRLAQLGILGAALRDFLTLWPLWQGDAQSFEQLVLATIPLVNVYRDMSATLAATYMESVRASQAVPGEATVTLASAIVPQQLVSSMFVTGQTMTRDAMQAGMTAAEARGTALTRVSGAVTRHVLNGGRQTVIDSVAADQHAVGWARVTDSKPCAFCLTLAARGAVYKSEATADFHAHDHCGCSVMPVYRGSVLPDTSQIWKKLYEQAQREAEADGSLNRGTSNDRLNAVRRLLSEQH